MVELDDIKIFGHSTLQLARKLMETVDDEYGADLWIDCEKREVLIISSKDKEIAENSMTHILDLEISSTSKIQFPPLSVLSKISCMIYSFWIRII